MGWIAKRRKEQSRFSYLLGQVQGLFATIGDYRCSNASISMKDILSSAFAMFSLKSASLLSFEKRSQAEEGNLQQLYGIGKICSDTQMREVLDRVPAGGLQTGFQSLYAVLKDCRIVEEYRYWKGKLIVSVDGVEHFSSKKVHCKHCLEKQHKDGQITYSHQMLSAVLVHPHKREVFPMRCEPIVNTDGCRKNDCERNAGKRLLEGLRQSYGDEKFLLVADALYANGPYIEQLQGDGHSFIIGIKPDGNKGLFSQFAARQKSEQAGQYSYSEKGIQHHFSWANNLPLNSSQAHIRVNMLHYEQVDEKGKTTTFSWITDIDLRQNNVAKVMRAGRARWKIENETFNTLKNQGYHFEHNYGHGQDELCTVLAYLMMIAFTVDQIRQYACEYFLALWQGLGTKAKLWQAIRAAFTMIQFQTMKQLFAFVAKQYKIQLE
jgi:hypothetical protein